MELNKNNIKQQATNWHTKKITGINPAGTLHLSKKYAKFK
jgi:hypothetical protein